MNVKVIKEFIDVHTNDYHGIGDKLIITDERFAEIQKVGNFVEQIADEQPEDGQQERSETVKPKRRKSKANKQESENK